MVVALDRVSVKSSAFLIRETDTKSIKTEHARVRINMNTKVLPESDATTAQEERIQNAREKWQNPSLARKTIQKIMFSTENNKSGIDLLVEEEHDHAHGPNAWYMIHPNNPIRR